jgi:hypothetical protein
MVAASAATLARLVAAEKSWNQPLPAVLVGSCRPCSFVVNARYSALNDRPSFGLYTHCHPQRRCAGCEDLCASEQHLAARLTVAGPGALTAVGSAAPTADRLSPSMAIELVAGLNGNGSFIWAAAEVFMPGMPQISQVYTPLLVPSDAGDVVRFVCPERRTLLTPSRGSLHFFTSRSGRALRETELRLGARRFRHELATRLGVVTPGAEAIEPQQGCR